jgi:hypothetical protein
MSARINELRKNNTSRVPGLRLRRRNGVLFVDWAAWVYVGGCERKRASNSFPADRAPVRATERAMAERAQATGVPYQMSPRRAWALLSMTRV